MNHSIPVRLMTNSTWSSFEPAHNWAFSSYATEYLIDTASYKISTPLNFSHFFVHTYIVCTYITHVGARLSWVVPKLAIITVFCVLCAVLSIRVHIGLIVLGVGYISRCTCRSLHGLHVHNRGLEDRGCVHVNHVENKLRGTCINNLYHGACGHNCTQYGAEKRWYFGSILFHPHKNEHYM